MPELSNPAHMKQLTKSPDFTYKCKYLIDKEYPYPVTLEWNRRPSMERWDEITEWAVEHFGLPGHKYRTEITTEQMTWFFESKTDQLIFTLAWGNDNGTDI